MGKPVVDPSQWIVPTSDQLDSATPAAKRQVLRSQKPYYYQGGKNGLPPERQPNLFTAPWHSNKDFGPYGPGRHVMATDPETGQMMPAGEYNEAFNTPAAQNMFKGMFQDMYSGNLTSKSQRDSGIMPPRGKPGYVRPNHQQGGSGFTQGSGSGARGNAWNPSANGGIGGNYPVGGGAPVSTGGVNNATLPGSGGGRSWSNNRVPGRPQQPPSDGGIVGDWGPEGTDPPGFPDGQDNFVHPEGPGLGNPGADPNPGGSNWSPEDGFGIYPVSPVRQFEALPPGADPNPGGGPSFAPGEYNPNQPQQKPNGEWAQGNAIGSKPFWTGSGPPPTSTGVGPGTRYPNPTAIPGGPSGQQNPMAQLQAAIARNGWR